MAEPSSPPSTPNKKAGLLSGSWHGVPKPALALVGVAGGYFVYKRVKAGKSSSSTASAAATPTCSATPTPSCPGSGAYGGGGQGSGGGAGGATPRNKKRGGTPTPSPLVGPDIGPAPPAPVAPAATPAAPAAPAAAPAQTAAPAAQIGSPTPSSGVPVGTFNLPKGSISFQPTVAVTRGGQVAYGIPNAPTAKSLNGLGGLVESGATLMSKGWTNLTPTADYLVR